MSSSEPNVTSTHSDATNDPAAHDDAARRATAQLLARIWAEVLGVERVGVHDNFFDLGGNSIRFLNVLAGARRAGLRLTFQQLFRHPTITELVDVLAAEGALLAAVPAPASASAPAPERFGPFELVSPADRALLPADAQAAYPLSMLQAGLIYQSEITRGTAQYHDIISYVIQTPFHAERFEAAVRALVRAHPILRTTYHLTEYSEYLQVVHADVAVPLEIVDLRHLDAADQTRWHERWLAAEQSRPFHWHEPRLVSWHVQVLADDVFRYSISQHNSALDGWSVSLLHTRLFELYLGEAGAPAPERPEDDHLRSYVGLERRALACPEDRVFWAELLDGAAGTVVPRPDAGTGRPFQVLVHKVDLPAALSDRVLRLAEDLAVPVKSVLLAAHVRVLGGLAGTDDVLTGYEQSGRPELDGADEAVGLFLNTVPFRVRLDQPSWRALIRAVYQAETDHLPHRRYPMARMKQDLGTQAGLFETTFNFTHFYRMRELTRRPGMRMLDIEVRGETEFVLRTEFSQHYADDRVELVFLYHADLFDDEHIERIGECFRQALEGMTADPAASHADLPALTSADGARGRPSSPLRTRGTPAHEGRDERAAPFEAPQTAAQRRVAQAWSDALGIPVERISLRDNFFDLGGNSLAALRVGMKLDGLVSLVDVMRNARLDALAALVESATVDTEPAKHAEHGGHLRLLAGNPRAAECALVCFPFGSGHAANFLPMARAVVRRNRKLVVYGVELPGHDPSRPYEPLADVPELARLVAAEITATIATPLMLWGHCSGAAPAVELARLLEAGDIDVRALLIGAKLLYRPDQLQESIGVVEGMSDADVIRWMVEVSDFTAEDGLDKAHTELVGRTFRHDALTGHRYCIGVQQRPFVPKLATPTTVVVTADDRIVESYPDDWRNWQQVATDVTLRVLEHGGHYFMRLGAELAAEVVDDAFTASFGPRAPSAALGAVRS